MPSAAQWARWNPRILASSVWCSTSKPLVTRITSVPPITNRPHAPSAVRTDTCRFVLRMHGLNRYGESGTDSTLVLPARFPYHGKIDPPQSGEPTPVSDTLSEWNMTSFEVALEEA